MENLSDQKLGQAQMLFKNEGLVNDLNLLGMMKGTQDFLKLRSSEADKVRCGKCRFEALGLDIEVVVTAAEV